MNSFPEIFDLRLLNTRRSRYNEKNKVNFLQKMCIDDTNERLNDLNRNFEEVGVLSDFFGLWSENLNLKKIQQIKYKEITDLKTNFFDFIICSFYLHWSNDPVGHIIQLKKSLKKDGLLLLFLLGGQTLKELRFTLNTLDSEENLNFSSKLSPMGDVKDYGNLLIRSGLSLSVADNFILEVEYPNLMKLFVDLRKMGETNVYLKRNKKNLYREDIRKIEEVYKSNFSCGTDKKNIKATFEIICLTGWAPSENQQKPLKPGSALKSFQDVLGFKEL